MNKDITPASPAPIWTPAAEAMRWLNEIEMVQGGANGPTIKLRAAIAAMGESAGAEICALPAKPLTEAKLMGLYMDFDRRADKAWSSAEYLLKFGAFISAATLAA